MDAAGSANATKMPELVAGIERVKRLANSLADLGDQLNGQANRLFGSPPPGPASPTDQIPLGKVGEGGPLLAQLADVFDTLDRNLQRARTGADRLEKLG
jgi:hypothetical protein